MCLKDALKKFSPTLSESRRALIASVVAARSNSVALLLENVVDEANACAVLRTMDAFGCLHLHRLETIPITPKDNSKKKKCAPRTDAGARPWVRIHRWSNAQQCVSQLKTQYGYTLASTSPDAPTPITSVDFSQKLLIAFGNEQHGISEELAELSDVKFSLPMCGFVRSFNISVAVALTLYHAYLYRTSIHVSQKQRSVLCTVCLYNNLALEDTSMHCRLHFTSKPLCKGQKMEVPMYYLRRGWGNIIDCLLCIK